MAGMTECPTAAEATTPDLCSCPPGYDHPSFCFMYPGVSCSTRDVRQSFSPRSHARQDTYAVHTGRKGFRTPLLSG
jgi:hypothetical protein